jgi:glycosyltransferase involved in cell wall biosynthesis
MRILFTGPLLDFSGFAHASRNFLKALIKTNNDIVARELVYDSSDEGKEYIPESWMLECLEKPLDGIEMVLQMTTCNIEAVPVKGVCNGLYTFLESDRVQKSWADKANSFDFIVVPCIANADALKRSGVTVPIVVCPLPSDNSVYEKEYPSLDLQIPDIKNKTVFYNICQLSGKKGIDSLLRAYYAAFADMPDDVVLVLKTYINMGNRSQDLEVVKSFIRAVREGCRIPTTKHPPVLPVIYTMTDDEINGLHKMADCYVCSSRAEGWGIPVFDALGHGKTIISNSYGGLAAFINKNNSLVYGGMSTMFFDVKHQDPGLFTGLEQCFEPSPAEMALLMRKFHLLNKAKKLNQLDEKSSAEWDSIINMRNNAIATAKAFDYNQMANNISEVLEKIYSDYKKSV